MRTVLILSGSARPNSAGKQLIDFVDQCASQHEEISVKVVDIAKLNLPFFDADKAPADPDFITNHSSVIDWTNMVRDADGFIFVTPEYNASMSAIQKNAIDWIYKEWIAKPCLLVGYGWHRAERVHNNARLVLNNVKAKVLDKTIGLMFKEDLDPDGKLLNQNHLKRNINEAIDNLIKELK